jgi:hypothetical protein
MRKSWLMCVLLGALAWGQAPPAMTPASPAQSPSATSKAPAPPSEVPENAVVLEIKGVCAAVPKTTAAPKTGAGKTASVPAKKPADCKTEITRAQFEKIADAVSPTPTITPQLKRQLESALPRIMAMSEAAKAKGIDKSPRFLERVKLDRMQILAVELQRTVQEEADKVPDTAIAQYYRKNPEGYEQFSLDRVFVPRYKQAAPDNKDKGDAKEPEKLTEEQQKAKEAADKAKREEGEQELNKLADGLRAQAAAGEDFAKLQQEAFEAAGTKVANPTVNLPKVRRTGLPTAHAAVFDLKVGEVSAVTSDNGGHYIYKVVSKEVLPLDQVKDEIRNKLKSERLKETMDKYTNSFQATPNEAYFGPAAPAGPSGRPAGVMPQQMPRPQTAQPQGTPPAANAPSQPPAQQPPPSNPN